MNLFRKKKKLTTPYQLGKKAAAHDPKDRTLKMAKYMVDLPDPPAEFNNIDVLNKKLDKIYPISTLYPLDGNDRLGDCVVAGIAHYLTTSNGRVGDFYIPTEQDVIREYKRRSRCGRDEGLVMMDALKYWRKNGFYDQKFLAFGRINPKNHKVVQQVIHLFGGVDLGFLVQERAFADFDAFKRGVDIVWQPGVSNGGGHCVVAIGYRENRETGKKEYLILTWGYYIWASEAWWDAMVDECFAILPDDAEKPGFAEGFDSETLKEDFELALIT